MLSSDNCCEIASALRQTGNGLSAVGPRNAANMTQHRKYYLHSRHIWTGESLEDEEPRWSVSDETTRGNSFLVEDIRQCLVLKLDGFVQGQKATVCDVSSDRVRLKVGDTWLGGIFSDKSCPLEMEIRFRPTQQAAEPGRNPRAEVEVVIHDRRMIRRTNRFEIAARRVMRELKHHLMAIQ